MSRAEAIETGGLERSEAGAEESLLERFAQQRDEAAFAGLVQRHGPQVLGLCRRILQHQQDAEDAFQATFLVLARKAGTISKRECVGSWLYSVAFRIAQRARAKRARLPVSEPNPPEIPVADPTPDLLWRDLRPILDEEVNRLSPKYREPFHLCYFEGKTNEEAAEEIGCPLGTILSRLSRARDQLRARLKRRGITLSACLLVSFLADQERASAMAPELAQSTVKAALLYSGAKPFAATAIPSSALTLADGLLKTIRRARVRKAAIGLLATTAGAVAALLLILMLAGGKTDQEKIQGAWKATRTQAAGQVMPDGGSEMRFQKDRFNLNCLVFGAANPFRDQGTFELRPDQSPKAVDFISANGQRALGIYLLEQDTLKICFNLGGPERPKDFVTYAGTGLILYELRRE